MATAHALVPRVQQLQGKEQRRACGGMRVVLCGTGGANAPSLDAAPGYYTGVCMQLTQTETSMAQTSPNTGSTAYPSTNETPDARMARVPFGLVVSAADARGCHGAGPTSSHGPDAEKETEMSFMDSAPKSTSTQRSSES